MLPHSKSIALIVAIGQNNEIGLGNKLLWHLPDDFKWFKSQTMGCPVIMGRKTFESIGKPLPGRLNIVLTTQQITIPGVEIAHTLEDAIAKAAMDSPKICIIGGDNVYKQAIADADELHVTHVHESFDADAFFPEIVKEDWKLTYSMFHPKDDKHAYAFELCSYIRA